MEQTIKVHFFSEKDENGNCIQDMQFATKNSAAVDIRILKFTEIKPRDYVVIPTGLYVSIPDGYCMKVYPRSGISAKTDLIFKNTTGIIDSDYRGRQVFVVYYNLSEDESIIFNQGDRIAQAMIEKVLPVEYILVDSIDQLKELGNDRGGGLGSTGLQ